MSLPRGDSFDVDIKVVLEIIGCVASGSYVFLFSSCLEVGSWNLEPVGG